MYIKIFLLVFLVIINLTACVNSQNTRQLQLADSKNADFTLLGPGGVRVKTPATQLPMKRLALVIGNSAYQASGLQLKNPINDAHAMTAALRSLGFTVREVDNADLTMMRDAVKSFNRQLKSNQGVGVFYFAGHGAQSPSGLNYLIPVDFDPKTVIDLAKHSLDAESVRKSMEQSDNPLNILILDACRDNPFATRSTLGARSISNKRGLARIPPARGTLVALSTSPGEVALDGEGNNGLYTSYLIKHIRTPGIDIREVFDRVGRDVTKKTKNYPKPQTPWYHTSVHSKFAFLPANAPVPALSPTTTNISNRTKRSLVVDFAMLHDNGTGQPVRLKNGDTLRSNAGYLFHIKTSGDEPKYIYLFQVDAKNKAFKLFPSAKYHTALNPVTSGTITLPNENEVFFLDNTVGQEKFYFLVSHKQEPALEQFQQGTISDLLDSGFPLRGPAGVRQKTDIVAAKSGDTNTVVQEFSFKQELTHTLTINHQ